MWDIVVVGSGYGGSVAAARLASGRRLLLLERGKRWQSGEFPQSLPQIASSLRSARNPLGYWSLRLGPGTGNAIVSALGGASLANYGITARPDASIFRDWPWAPHALDEGFARAESVLAASPNPLVDSLADRAFLEAMEPGRSVALRNAIDWSRCRQCGHCVPGCNYAAKRSLDRSYLPLAEQAGAFIRDRSEVRHFEPRPGGGYRLWVVRSDRPQEGEWIEAARVILAAGTFGSLELLRRSSAFFTWSPALGQGMSMNGDALALIYATRHRLDAEHGAPISSAVRLQVEVGGGETRALTIMSGRIPHSIHHASARLLVGLAPLWGRLPGQGAPPSSSRPLPSLSMLADLRGAAKGGALSRSFLYKLDAQDAARGKAGFDASGEAHIAWPDYGDDPVLQAAWQRMDRWASASGGRIVPGLSLWFGHHLGVHPLGGCRMGESFETSVVNRYGEVWHPEGGVYEGLQILDGSIVPGALGVPPSLTITALTESILAASQSKPRSA